MIGAAPLIMDAFLAWLTAIEEQYPWLGPASAIVGIVGAAVAIIMWLYRIIVGKAYRIRREVEEKNERLEADLEALRSEIKLLKGEIKLLKERLPETAWVLADRERTDGNEEAAIRVLRRHINTEGSA